MSTNAKETSSQGPEKSQLPGICFIYKEDYPWDVRVEKIINTLSRNGYQVTLICRNNKRLPRQEALEGIQIRRLPCLPSFLGKLNNLVSIPFYFNPFWLFWMFRYIRDAKPAAIVVRDLPLMPMGILVAKTLGLKSIFDMAECYPEMYASTIEYSDRKLLKFLLKNPSLAGLLEKFCFKNADQIFVMIEESRDRLLSLGADPGKITIVSNTPEIRDPSPPRKYDEGAPLRLFYVGFITRIRGLDNVLRGIKKYLDDGGAEKDIVFDVVGIGAARDYYNELSNSLGLENIVKFHGWCEQSTVDELYKNCDIGVLTYHICSHWNHTIPNKLFDYMINEIPVLSTQVKPIQRIVTEANCGVSIPDNDPEKFAHSLKQLFSSSLRAEMGQNGRGAIQMAYNWGEDSRRMLHSMHEILTS